MLRPIGAGPRADFDPGLTGASSGGQGPEVPRAWTVDSGSRTFPGYRPAHPTMAALATPTCPLGEAHGHGSPTTVRVHGAPRYRRRSSRKSPPRADDKRDLAAHHSVPVTRSRPSAFPPAGRWWRSLRLPCRPVVVAAARARRRRRKQRAERWRQSASQVGPLPTTKGTGAHNDSDIEERRQLRRCFGWLFLPEQAASARVSAVHDGAPARVR
jgi:hypothetical protein